MKTHLKFGALALLLSTINYGLSTCHAQGTAFTYNGKLDDGGAPASGVYDLQFTLFDALAGGGAVGSTATSEDVGVTNGLFTVTLDLGAPPWSGADRWLEVAVRPGASVGAYTTLAPRQPITSTPYAIRAANYGGAVAASQLTGNILPANIAAGSITGTMLASNAVTTPALTDGSVTAEKLATVTVSNWFGLAITNPTPALHDNFGDCVAMVGSDRVLVGVSSDDTSAAAAGAAYLFSANGTLLTTFTKPIPVAGDQFGISVAAVGSDRVLIGAFSDNTGASDTGAAYLFNTNGTLLTTFTNPTPSSLEQFGRAVAAAGNDGVLISAPFASTGEAYLFSANGALLTTFTNPTPASGDQFGYSVAAVGSNYVLIGADKDDIGAENAGVAYLFSTNGALLTTFTNPTPEINEEFGYAVAAVGSGHVLIGAYRNRTGVDEFGAAYLYSTNGTLLTTFAKPVPVAGDNFGYSVAAMGNDRVLIGAHLDDTGANNTGAVYLFSTNGTLLNTFTNPTPVSGDEFGSSVAAGGDRVLVGASMNDTGAENAGAVFLFTLGGGETYMPELIAEGVRSGSIDSDSIADGTITAADLDPAALSSLQTWKLDGNTNTSPATNFVGTADNQALVFKVDKKRALLLEPNSKGQPNLTGGSAQNQISPANDGGIIAGGHQNLIWTGADYAAIGGGLQNRIAANATHTVIAGGTGNYIGTNSSKSAIGGGQNNNVGTNSQHAVIAGGALNDIGANTDAAVIAGGDQNSIGTNASSSAISGGTDNTIGDGSPSAVIAGGDSHQIDKDSSHSAMGGGENHYVGTNSPYATIAGGHQNVIGANTASSSIGGGEYNVIGTNAYRSIIGGGIQNHISDNATRSTIGGGILNQIGYNAWVSTIGGGGGNMILGSLDSFSMQSTIGGGEANEIHAGAHDSTISGGNSHQIQTNAHHSTIGGGVLNRIQTNSSNSTISGGRENTIGNDSESATIAGGSYNAIGRNSGFSFMGGGQQNTIGADSHHAVVVGGNINVIGGASHFASIVGGIGNTLGTNCNASFVGGGFYNTMADQSQFATLIGGGLNSLGTNSDYSAIGGGYHNSIGHEAQYATVAGGYYNKAAGDYSFAAGREAQAMHEGSFVWSDSQGSYFLSETNNEVAFRCQNGVRFTSSYAGPAQTVAWTPGSASWSFTSDRHTKDRVTPLNPQSVLAKLARIPIAEWSYIGYAQRHVGPMAQDFHAEFPLNENDKVLNDADLHGVALAAIQGLDQKVESGKLKVETQLTELQRENAALKARLEKLEQRLHTQPRANQ